MINIIINIPGMRVRIFLTESWLQPNNTSVFNVESDSFNVSWTLGDILMYSPHINVTATPYRRYSLPASVQCQRLNGTSAFCHGLTPGCMHLVMVDVRLNNVFRQDNTSERTRNLIIIMHVCTQRMFIFKCCLLLIVLK